MRNSHPVAVHTHSAVFKLFCTVQKLNFITIHNFLLFKCFHSSYDLTYHEFLAKKKYID